MQNKKLSFKRVGLTLIVIFALVAAGYFVMQKIQSNPRNEMPIFVPEKNINSEILGNKDDLISLSILPGVAVHDVLSYRGAIKGGYFFEGNVVINILDTNKKILKTSNAVAKSDWMTAEPVNFEGNIDFTSLPKGPAYFEIHNDNASGLPENDKSVLVPIVIE